LFTALPPLLILFFFLVQINGKLGTEHLTEATANTGVRVFDARWMVALGIELVGLFQHVARTILYTKTTTFASFLQYVYVAVGDLYLLDIQRLSPILHLVLLNPYLEAYPENAHGGHKSAAGLGSSRSKKTVRIGTEFSQQNGGIHSLSPRYTCH